MSIHRLKNLPLILHKYLQNEAFLFKQKPTNARQPPDIPPRCPPQAAMHKPFASGARPRMPPDPHKQWLGDLNIHKNNVGVAMPFAPSPIHHHFYGWDSNHQKLGGAKDIAIPTLTDLWMQRTWHGGCPGHGGHGGHGCRHLCWC